MRLYEQKLLQGFKQWLLFGGRKEEAVGQWRALSRCVRRQVGESGMSNDVQNVRALFAEQGLNVRATSEAIATTAANA